MLTNSKVFVMKTNRIVVTLLITLLFCLSIASPSHAARIYNDLNRQVQVQGYSVEPLQFLIPDNPSKRIRIDSGVRSESLQWDAITFVAVFDANSREELCRIGFGAHNEIVGGNYMYIQPSGNSANCYVCDSNHKPIVGNGQC
jgi:hypothetical protein